MGPASRKKSYVQAKAGPITRREFARQAATAAAALAALPGRIPLSAAVPAPDAANFAELPLPQEIAGGHPKLSPEALAEAEARAAEVIRRYGAKLSEEQKADVRRLSREAQAQLEPLRAFPLDNREEPAVIFGVTRAGGLRRTPASQASAARKPAGEGA